LRFALDHGDFVVGQVVEFINEAVKPRILTIVYPGDWEILILPPRTVMIDPASSSA